MIINVLGWWLILSIVFKNRKENKESRNKFQNFEKAMKRWGKRSGISDTYASYHKDIYHDQFIHAGSKRMKIGIEIYDFFIKEAPKEKIEMYYGGSFYIEYTFSVRIELYPKNGKFYENHESMNFYYTDSWNHRDYRLDPNNQNYFGRLPKSSDKPIYFSEDDCSKIISQLKKKIYSSNKYKQQLENVLKTFYYET